MSTAKDSRRDPRAKVLSMTVRYKSASVAEFVENHSHDVSRGGLFIKTPSPFPAGTLIKFEVKIANEQRVMMGVGRVAWKRESALGEERPAGMGVKFIKMDKDSIALIDSLVSQRNGTESTFEMGAKESGVSLSAPPTSLRGRTSVNPISRPSRPPPHRSHTPIPPAAGVPAMGLGADFEDEEDDEESRATLPTGAEALRDVAATAFKANDSEKPAQPHADSDQQANVLPTTDDAGAEPVPQAEAEIQAETAIPSDPVEAEAQAPPPPSESQEPSDTETEDAEPDETEAEEAETGDESEELDESESTLEAQDAEAAKQRPSQRPKGSRKRNKKPKKKKKKFRSSIPAPRSSSDPPRAAAAKSYDSAPPISELVTTPPLRREAQRPSSKPKSKTGPILLVAAILLGLGLLWLNANKKSSSTEKAETSGSKVETAAKSTPAPSVNPEPALKPTSNAPADTLAEAEDETAEPPDTQQADDTHPAEAESEQEDKTPAQVAKEKRLAQKYWRDYQKKMAKKTGTTPPASETSKPSAGNPGPAQATAAPAPKAPKPTPAPTAKSSASPPPPSAPKAAEPAPKPAEPAPVKSAPSAAPAKTAAPAAPKTKPAPQPSAPAPAPGPPAGN